MNMGRKQPLKEKKHNPLSLQKIERIVQTEQKFSTLRAEVKTK